jgi:hypothetical protein
MKHLTLDKILFGIFVILLTLSIRYSGIAHFLLSLILNNVSEYLEWFFSGILCLFIKLSMKGVIEEFANEWLSSIRSYFVIYCADNTDSTPMPPRKEYGGELLNGRRCTILHEDPFGNPILLPLVGNKELLENPFKDTSKEWFMLNQRERDVVNMLTREINDFNRIHIEGEYIKGIWTETHERDDFLRRQQMIGQPLDPRTYVSGWVVGEMAILQTIADPKPYSFQQFNTFSRNKIERAMMYKNASNKVIEAIRAENIAKNRAQTNA